MVRLKLAAPKLVGATLGVLLCCCGLVPVHAQPNEESLPRHVDILVRSKALPSLSTAAVSRYGITRYDVHRITKEVPDLVSVVPVRYLSLEARFGARAITARVVGTTEKFAHGDSLAIQRGRFLAQKDLKHLNNVVVLSSVAAQQLFGGVNPLGKNIRVRNHYFLIVGVVETPPPRQQRRRGDQHPAIYIPISTMRSRFGDQVILRENGTFEVENYELSELRIVAGEQTNIDDTATQIQEVLQTTHESADYSILIR